MGRSFNFYTFSLAFFYNEVLGSKNQDFIERAFKELLDWEMKYGEEDTHNMYLDLYRYQLNLLVNQGKYEIDDFPWQNYPFEKEVQGTKKDLEYAAKYKAITALFTLQPESNEFGGYKHERYKILFANLQKVLPEREQEGQLWKFLLKGRPLSGDTIFASDDGYSYYGYLTHEEALRLFKSVELLKRPENQAKLNKLPEETFSKYAPIRFDLDALVKQIPGAVESLKNPENLAKFKDFTEKAFNTNPYNHPDLEVLDFEINELSTGRGDLFFRVG